MPEEVFDVVVVGAGVAGALIAWKLAGTGARILLLEAGEGQRGRTELVGKYARSVGKSPGSPYRTDDRRVISPDSEHDYYVQDGETPYRSTYQRREGGTTWHWLGNVPRLIPSDFQLYSRYGVGVDWPIGYSDLERWYGEAERELGVAGDHEEWDGLLGAYRSEPFPMSRIWPSYGDTVVTPGIQGLEVDGVPLRVNTTPQARNSRPYDGRPACAGNSSCVPICPIQAKYDASVHVKKARDAEVEVRARSVVFRLEVAEDGRIARVIYRDWEKGDHPVRAGIVVLAAHAIETPKLLLYSRSERAPNGVANRSDQVGRNLMDHLQGQGGAILREPVFPFRGPPTTSGIDTFRDGPFRGRHAAFRMSLGNDGWGRMESPTTLVRTLINEENLFGQELRERVAQRITRQFRISYSTEMLPRPENRVTLAADTLDDLGIPHPKLETGLDEYNIRAFEVARRVMGTVFSALGAVETRFSSDPASYSGAGHIMGTCRMGRDPATSVVDPECRSHDHPNLYIVGGSVFPTGGTANPTLTIAALALRAAAAIRARIPRGGL
jgi:glucose dehydrogenase